MLNEDFTADGPQGDEVGGLPGPWNSLFSAGGLWNAVTLCTAVLPVTLGPASMRASHPGPSAVSNPLVGLVGVAPPPFTRIVSLGLWRVLTAGDCSVSPPLAVAQTHSLSLSQCRTFPMCLCAEQRILC